MKKTLWIFATIALFFIGDRLGGTLLKKVVDNSQFRYSRMYQGNAQSDILLLGNSRGLIFYQPYIEEITGKRTFNLSYNGLPIDLAQKLAMDYLNQYEPPETMIIDVTMCDRWNTQMISGFSLYGPYSENLRQLIHKNDKNVFHATRLSHLFRYNSEIFQRALFYLKKNDEDWLLDREINSFMIEDVVNIEDYKIGYDSTLLMFNNLTELVQEAKSKGVSVHLVINPYFPAFAKKISNLEEMKKAIKSKTGMEVHDYSTAVSDPKCFADYQHLNKYGSRLYLDQLKKDGILK